jgi:hypothetical protein
MTGKTSARPAPLSWLGSISGMLAVAACHGTPAAQLLSLVGFSVDRSNAGEAGRGAADGPQRLRRRSRWRENRGRAGGGLSSSTAEYSTFPRLRGQIYRGSLGQIAQPASIRAPEGCRIV